VTVQEDGFIAEDTAYEFVHCWFFKCATVLFAIAVECCRTCDFFFKKVGDIYNKQGFLRDFTN